MHECVPKVSELRRRFPDKDIEVDGGVGPANIHTCADAGMYRVLTSIYSGAQCFLFFLKGATWWSLELRYLQLKSQMTSSRYSRPQLILRKRT